MTVDLQGEAIPYDRYFQKCIGSCHAYLALREDYREQLRLVQKEIGFKMLRFHGLFCEDVGICLEGAGKEYVYNFQNADKIFDFLIGLGIRPFLELGFMPKALASRLDRLGFVYEGYISPPREYAEWEDLIKACVNHWIERYGLTEVLSWRFEVWNEPDLECFFSGTRDEYFKLYEHTARALKSINRNLLVGGPATSKNHWINEFLEYCQTNKVPVDFVSTHHYCSETALDLDGSLSLQYRGQQIMQEEVSETVEKVKRSHVPNAEVMYTEWNTTPVHVDTFGKDSEFTATFVLETIRANANKLAVYAFWTFSDIFEETGPVLYPFSGRYGILNIHGIKKPVFHAWVALSRMYDYEIKTTEKSCIVTRSIDHNYRAVSWLHTEPTKTDFTGGDWDIPKAQKEETISLHGIHGAYRIRAWMVSATSGNAFRAWQKMGKPVYLSKEQIELLKDASIPVNVRDEIMEADGTLELKHLLSQNSFIYYDLERIGL